MKLTQIKQISSFLIAVLFLIFMNSCAQLSLFQDAKTVGKGNNTIAGTVTAYGVSSSDNSDFGNIVLPSIILSGTHGISDKIDLQLSASLAGSLLFAPKIQLLGDQISKWAFAINPGIEAHIGDFDNQDIFLLRSHFSAIGSFHPSEKLSFFAEPRCIIQHRNDQDNDLFLGSTVGVKFRLGGITDLAIGASFYDVIEEPELLYQIGLGLTFKLNSNK